jgi:hypothetical protein
MGIVMWPVYRRHIYTIGQVVRSSGWLYGWLVAILGRLVVSIHGCANLTASQRQVLWKVDGCLVGYILMLVRYNRTTEGYMDSWHAWGKA